MILAQALNAAAGQRLGPVQYVAEDTDPTPDGWVPFDIEVLGFAAHHVGVGAQTLQHRVGGALVGPPLSIEPRMTRSVTFLTPFTVLGVNTLNIDTTSRWGVDRSALDPTNITWAYRSVATQHRGKLILGIGGTQLLNANSASPRGGGPDALLPKNFASFFHHRGISGVGGVGPYAGQWFYTPFETESDLRAYMNANNANGERYPCATFPWLTPGTFQDFMLVLKSAPTGTWTIAFRKNKTEMLRFEVVPGTQRIFYPNSGVFSSVSALQGDLFSWQVLATDGVLDAQLLWTFTQSSFAGLSGYGELGYGEGGYGTV